jgi:hypothetical protein
MSKEDFEHLTTPIAMLGGKVRLAVGGPGNVHASRDPVIAQRVIDVIEGRAVIVYKCDLYGPSLNSGGNDHG